MVRGAPTGILSWNYTKHYARFHPDTAEHFAGTVEVFTRWLKPHLHGREGAVLDVGCGRGYALAALRGLGITSVEGIDTSSEQIAWAAERGLPAKLVQDTGEYLRRRPATYDTVLLMDVIEHVEPLDQRGLLGAIARALKPGGTLLLTTPNAASRLAAYTRHLDYTHTCGFTPESLDYLLIHSGFEPACYLELEPVGPPRRLIFVPTPRTLRWWALRALRSWRRLELRLELGSVRASVLPVSPSMLAVARRSGSADAD
jgi:SAM-dependent methyltransferase